MTPPAAGREWVSGDASAWWRREPDGAVTAVAAAEVPFLPEPFEGDRSDAERRAFQDAMTYMARALHGLGDGPGTRRTFEVRLAAPETGGSVRLVSIFFLVHSRVAGAAPEQRIGDSGISDPDGVRDPDESAAGDDLVATAGADAISAVRLLVALAPQRLACQVVRWSAPSEMTGQRPVDRALLGVEPPWAARLRKYEILTWAKELDRLSIEDRIEQSRRHLAQRRRSRGLIFPASLPRTQGDLLPVVSVMSSAPGALVLRVMLRPTTLATAEYRAATELDHELAMLVESAAPGASFAARARAAVTAVLTATQIFAFDACVLGANPESVRSVAAAWRMEYSQPARRPEAEIPVVSVPVTAGDPVDPRDDVRQTSSQLVRFGELVTATEAAALWRLPVVRPGGQAGIASRPVNPFEQLPVLRDDHFGGLGAGFLRAGRVRHRGHSLPANFLLPAVAGPAGPGVLDRVLLAVGSPGSGKTNFALNVLDDIHALGHPFLVLDPTLGREFRRLAADDLIVFTVGDNTENPLRFNPFAVPAKVSVQTHITRLMSCLRSAFWMWDPLPAIFEEAIYLAYARQLAPGREKSWRAADWRGADLTHPPTLDDLIKAMGDGEPGEQDTVLDRMRYLWGAEGRATENQATILASTTLRLRSLERGYGHIIGDAGGADGFTDVSQLLNRPVVLELGMIGDSQALALIASFLLVCLVGAIETRGQETDEDAGYHMLVIEEAHRLLASGATSHGSDAGDPSAQAAQDLNNMLAEVRKYRQGVMVLDQRPGSLVGGVIDNAYVVAMHRLGERAGFEQLSDMLNLTAEQRRYARVGLDVGEAVMFDRLLGAPVLVKPSRYEPVGKPAGPEEWRRRARELASGAPGGFPDAVVARAQEILDLLLADEDGDWVVEELFDFVVGGEAGAVTVERVLNHYLRRLTDEDESIGPVVAECLTAMIVESLADRPAEIPADVDDEDEGADEDDVWEDAVPRRHETRDEQAEPRHR